MTRKAEPLTAAGLAAELAVPGLLSGTLSSPRDKASTLVRSKVRRISHAPPTWQVEEFRGQKAFHENLDAPGLEARLGRELGAVWGRAEFTLDSGTISVLANRRGELTAIRKRNDSPTTENDANSTTDQTAPGANCPSGPCPTGPGVPGKRAAATAGHDRAKRRILAEGVPVPFLVDLGVMTADGAVIKRMYDKFRQINRYLEFVEDALPDLLRRFDEGKGELTIVDFGCGKSYLTFAVYHYLANLKGLPVRIVGLDLKDDVIASCSALATRYGYAGLSFSVGDIAGYRGLDRADMVMTLHACDTATDAALDQAVRWNAAVILSVPCCQHELNAQLGARTASVRGGAGSDPASEALASGRADYPGRDLLEPAFRHGIVRERMAALITDSLRAELLEAAGYKVQLLEFIDMSHTPKNLLIRATLRGSEARSPEPSGRYRALKEALGVDPALERYLTAPKEAR